MALVVANRVQETTTTTGTGTVTLAGAVAGYQSFAAIGDGNTTYYTLTSGNDWEVGIGTYTLSGTTLARTTVLASSAGGTTKITLSGTSNVFVTYPSNKALYTDASGNAIALGTPASGTVTNLTGTASININGTVGATTPSTLAATTGSFTGVQTINLNTTGSLPTPTAGTALQIGQADAVANRLWFNTFAQASNINFMRADGTLASPSALASATLIGNIAGHGYSNGAYNTVSNISLQMFTLNAWTASDRSTYFQFNTTASGLTSAASSGTITSTGFQGAIGATTPSTGAFTTLSATGATTTLGSGGAATQGQLYLNGGTDSSKGSGVIFQRGSADKCWIGTDGWSTGASSNSDMAYWAISGLGHKWYTNGSATTKMELTSAGVLDLPIGQIKFPATQNASADANTLDDYEEGTWTPGVSFGGGAVGITYSSSGAAYTKIGRQVTCWFYFAMSAKGSSTGAAKITGLPFTISTANATYGVVAGIPSVYNFTGITGGVAINNFGTGSGVTTLDIGTGNVTGTATGVSDTNFNASTNIAATFSYNA
jgi:hypothetical protein